MDICRNSLILGLSYAIDILGNANFSHSKSTAYVAVMISRELGHAPETTREIYYGALLHDIGLGCYESEKLEVYKIGMMKHCVVGSEMVEKLPLPPNIAQTIKYHHENIDGSGPFGLKGPEIPLGSQLINLADMFDDIFGNRSDYNRDLFIDIKSWLISAKHLFFDSIICAFESLIEREFFLLEYFNHETKYALARRINIEDNVRYGAKDVEAFARCFAQVIDQRSPFTFKHSSGIANLALQAASCLGYNDEIQSKMYIAGYLHDIGKMHVSSDILNKPGPLTADERFEMNKHTYFTRKILEQVEGLGDIVDIAANHHERLDGKGYPYKKKGDELGELERIMSICDVYQALTEERPYRKSLPKEKVWAIIDDMVERQQLDAGLVEKLKAVF